MSSRERRSKRAVADARMRLGAAKRRTRAFDVKEHYISVRDADLIKRIVAGDLAASLALCLKGRRVLAAARTGECAARRVGAALGYFGAAVCRGERGARGP